jgi:hypothetical protein
MLQDTFQTVDVDGVVRRNIAPSGTPIEGAALVMQVLMALGIVLLVFSLTAIIREKRREKRTRTRRSD